MPIDETTTQSANREFWTVELASLYVCTACYEQVFWKKIPKPSCHECGAFSSYEPFAIDHIREWANSRLVDQAEKALADTAASTIENDRLGAD